MNNNMFQYLKNWFTIQFRILQRLEDLEENQKIQDKMMLLLWKRTNIKKIKVFPKKMRTKRT